VSWLLGDRQGSITTTITAGTATTRWYLPYGGRRGPTPGSVPTTTGFLGKHEDGSGLTHLEHRDYDPTTGVFITVDPLVASTGDPYNYAAGNPTTLSDPNGLCAGREGTIGGCGIDYYGGGGYDVNGGYAGPLCGQGRHGLWPARGREGSDCGTACGGRR
jgi:RHS repeat-associated protein